MRHKYLILGLSVMLIVLIVAKSFEPTQFPLRIDYYDYAHSTKGEQKLAKKSDKLIEFRMSQDFADIPWDVFSIGSNSKFINVNSKNTTDSTIVLNGNIIDARIVKFFSPSDKLIEIDLYFRDALQVTANVLSMYGKNYLEVYHEYDNLRFFWIKGSTLVVYEIDILGTRDCGYLTIADVSDFSDVELKDFIRYGHISHYSVQEPIIQSYLERYRTPRSYTPSTTTKKYGDSDTYQGSSKQKEDLEAIDRYFGL